MSKQLLLLCMLSLYCFSAQSQVWQVYPSSPSSERFEDIFFVDAQQGWTVNKEGQIFKTTDGGANWREVYNEPDYFFRSVEFLNDKIGFVGTLNEDLLRTTDGGETWTKLDIPDGVRALCGLAHLGDNVYGVGAWFNPAFFIKSTDQGETWIYKDLRDLANGLVDVHFVNEDLGFAAGIIENEGAVILKTTDGGENWETVHNTGRGLEYLWKLDFVTEKIAYGSVASYNGPPTIILKTTDGGSTWEELEVTEDENLETQGIGFANENLGWVGPKFQALYETRNGGQTWEQLEAFSNINKIFRLDTQHLYAAGSRLYTIEGEITNSVNINEPPIEKRIVKVAPNPFDQNLRLDIEIDKHTHAKVDVFDLSGKHLLSIYDAALNEGIHQFNIHQSETEQWSPGTYVVLLRTHNGGESVQIVKH